MLAVIAVVLELLTAYVLVGALKLSPITTLSDAPADRLIESEHPIPRQVHDRTS